MINIVLTEVGGEGGMLIIIITFLIISNICQNKDLRLDFRVFFISVTKNLDYFLHYKKVKYTL